MKKERLMDQAEQVMATYVCKDLDGEVRVEMDRLVHRFFSDHVRGLDTSEIMDRMVTPMKALEWFNEYLCETFRNLCCASPVSPDADTCVIS